MVHQQFHLINLKLYNKKPNFSNYAIYSNPYNTYPKPTDLKFKYSAGPKVIINCESLVLIFGLAVVKIPALS